MHSRHLNINGYRLHYLEAGRGPAVLLLHGFGSSADVWRGTGDILARAGYRALAFDCLGFGRSDKPTDAPYSLELIAGLYAAALDKLGIERVAIVAHSMGGKYALATALLHPERVTGLKLIATDGFAPAAAMSKIGKYPLACWFMLWLSGRRPLVSAMMGAAFHQPEVFATDEIIDQSCQAFHGWENIHALTALSQRYDHTDLELTGMRARLGELRVPSLIAWGENDQIFPVAQSTIAVSEIPNSRLITFPNCGHFPQIEASRPFHGLLLGLLATL